MAKLHLSVVAIGILAMVLSGCTTTRNSQGMDPGKSFTPGHLSGGADTADPSDSLLAGGNDSTSQDPEPIVSDSLISTMLENVRVHYVTALNAQDAGDSVLSASQFETSIEILNELSYVPDIENNRDFNDLSKAVVEDYQQYISKVDSLGSQASIFALRAKLDQYVESNEADTTVAPTEVIRTTGVPLVMNDIVQRNISFFEGRGRSHMERWLAESGKYFPMMRRILAEEGVPQDLVYLTMVESGVNPLARSWAKAVGMWQFVKGTGRLYGLRGDYWYDQRRNIEMATRAAARHMRDLYDQFGDWYLVLASYNAGAGRVYRAIRRSGGETDFWKIRRKLPRETRNYVPEFIAASLIAMHPEQYGFEGITPEAPLNYETVEVKDCVDLEILARCASTDVETIRELNPELVQWTTPPRSSGYRLRIPVGASEAFKARYAQIPDDQKRDYIVHTIRRGETLSSIAKHFGVPQSAIAQVNRLYGYRRLPRGRAILIPVLKGSERLAQLARAQSPLDIDRSGSVQNRSSQRDRTRFERAIAQGKMAGSSDSQNDKRGTVRYRIRRGETLSEIAMKFRVRQIDIRNWNNIPFGRKIIAGKTLIIHRGAESQTIAADDEPMAEAVAPAVGSTGNQARIDDSKDAPDKTIRYVVKRGETLWDIARAHNTQLEQIKAQNGISTSRIYAGQVLFIPVSTR